ncbi:hypothetical protein GCM10009591_26650 [Brachybacterium tyrofermentans]
MCRAFSPGARRAVSGTVAGRADVLIVGNAPVVVCARALDGSRAGIGRRGTASDTVRLRTGGQGERRRPWGRDHAGKQNTPARVAPAMTTPNTIGIIGAGHIGSQVARAVIAAGYDVVIANSRGPETLTDLVAELGPKARAATAEDAGTAGEVVVVTVPLHALDSIPVEPLAGKIVLDTNNYYYERDGRIDDLDQGETTTSQMLQEHLPTSKVVKAFNHIPFGDITTDTAPAGSPNRRALAVSSDFPEAVEFAVRLYDELGFDAVDVSPLSESWRVERDRPAYVVRQTAAELRENLAAANRLP